MKNPFVGMRPYGEREQTAFFGRNTDINYLLNTVDASGISLLYAKTGVGKSSLLHAGIIPQLRKNQFVLPILMSNWRNGFRVCLSREIEQEPYSSLQNLIDNIHTFSEHNDDRSIIFIFDQFEELLVGSNAEMVDEIAESISAIVNTTCPAGVLISMREEFLAELSPFSIRIPSLHDNQYRLLGFSTEQATEVLQKIAESSTENIDWPITLSQDIAGAVMGYSANSHVGEYLHMGLAQIISFYLFEKAVSENLEKLSVQNLIGAGGVNGIIDSFSYHRIDKLLDRAEQIVFAGICKYLFTKSGTKISVTLDDVSSFFSFDEIPTKLKPIVYDSWGLSSVHRGLSSGNVQMRIKSIFDVLSDDGFFIRCNTRNYLGDDVYVIQHDVAMLLLSRWRALVFHDELTANWPGFAYEVAKKGKLEYYYYSVAADLPSCVLAIVENLRDQIVDAVSSQESIELVQKTPITITQLLEDVMAFRHPILDLAYRDVNRTTSGDFFSIGSIDTCVLVFHKDNAEHICEELGQNDYFIESEPNWFDQKAERASISDVFEVADRQSPVPFGIYCQTSTTIENALFHIADRWINEGRPFRRVVKHLSDTPFGSDRDLRAILNNIVYSKQIARNDLSQLQYVALVDWPLFKKLKGSEQYCSTLAFLPIKYEHAMQAGYFLPPRDPVFSNIVRSCIESALFTSGHWHPEFVKYAEQNLVRLD